MRSDAFQFLKALVAVSGRVVEIKRGPCTTPFDREIMCCVTRHWQYGTVFDHTHEGVREAIGYYTRCRVQTGIYNYPVKDPARLGRRDAFIAIRQSMDIGQWTKRKRAAWLRAAVRLREVNRSQVREAAYYTGWIALLKSHLSGKFSSMPHKDVSRFIMSSPAHHDWYPICEREISIIACPLLSVSVLCVFALAWLSPFFAVLLLMAIERGVVEMFSDETHERTSLPMPRSGRVRDNFYAEEEYR
jgi:hypothetical protein